LGTPWPALDGGRRLLLLGGYLGLGGGLLRVAADDLLDAQRKRTPLLGADQRQGEEGQPGHRLAIQTGKEAIQAMGVCARFGGHHSTAYEPGDILGTVHMLTKEHPKQGGPWDRGGEQALDRTVTAACAGPAGEPQHRYTARDHQHGRHDPTELAQGGRGHMGVEALAKCYKIDHGGAPLWCVSGHLAQCHSTRQRTTLPHVWRRY